MFLIVNELRCGEAAGKKKKNRLGLLKIIESARMFFFTWQCMSNCLFGRDHGPMCYAPAGCSSGDLLHSLASLPSTPPPTERSRSDTSAPQGRSMADVKPSISV